MARWRKPFAIHDPGKFVSDLAITLALGGDCLADLTPPCSPTRRPCTGGWLPIRPFPG